MNIPTDVTSIVEDEDGVDDVAISVHDGDMYRLERMDKGSFWSCIYMDGYRHVFWFYAKKGRITVEHRVEQMPELLT